jgi:hypothetical protein
MIRQHGIDNGAFVAPVSPDTVWYNSVSIARYCLVCSGFIPFSAPAATDTGSKSFDFALVPTLESYDDPENGNYMHYTNYTQ